MDAKTKTPNKNKIWRVVHIVLIIVGIIFVLLIIFALLFGMGESRKPAIYLYPTEDTQVSVKLDISGFITKDIPKYNGGWNVLATKEGLIDNQYDYLFYEAQLYNVKVPEEGWIVAYDNLDNWFEVNLIKLGLNEKEKNQFKEYWLKELPKSNYYEIKLLSKEYLNKNMKLIISPQPDTTIRVHFLFKQIKENKHIKNPEITTPKREGFTVVEWGGILDNRLIKI